LFAKPPKGKGFLMKQAGMRGGVGDYDLDGHLDIFKTFPRGYSRMGEGVESQARVFRIKCFFRIRKATPDIRVEVLRLISLGKV
jgi:hypothetical protein